MSIVRQRFSPKLGSKLSMDGLPRGARWGHGQPAARYEAARPSLRREPGIRAGHVVGQTGYDSILSA